MSKHIFGCMLTHYGVASNNRGETAGNTTTLRKNMWHGKQHSSFSPESIRYAARIGMEAMNPEGVNRRTLHNGGLNQAACYTDPNFNEFVAGHYFSDDDVLGFMNAKSAGVPEAEADTDTEAEADTEADTKKGPKKGPKKATKNETRARRGALDITPAMSLTPYMGDVTFNAASPGASAAAQKGAADEAAKNPVPYSTEIHATRYQYNFAMSMDGLKDSKHALLIIQSLCNLGRVAGNHARYLFDCSPESMILRLTDDMAPRICYAFEEKKNDQIDASTLLFKVEAGDIDPKELYIAGPFAQTETGKILAKLGVHSFNGVKAAEAAVLNVIQTWIDEAAKKGAK